MSRVKVGFPDGDGVLGGYEFWKKYCDTAEVELVDVTHKLSELQVISQSIFPYNICLASKYRIGRAILLAPLVDYMIFFLFNDEYVYNCPNSVYRIKWIKAYLKNKGLSTKVITWPFDFGTPSNIQMNFINLTELIKGNVLNIKNFVIEIKNIPNRLLAYNFGYKKGKKNILLIGKIPFILDPYSKTILMDQLIVHYGVLIPHLIMHNDVSLLDKKDANVVFYKENSILTAIDIAVKSYDIHCVVLAADIFDIPGNYTFPIIKQYLDGINIPYMHLKVTLNNQHKVAQSIVEKIENI